jgi:MYXO-CTERM domain-containing protein
MLEKRHYLPARNSGRVAFGLLSVLALLALACFPVFVQADSSQIQYEPARPSATGLPPADNQPPANSSGAGGGTPGSSGSSSGGSSAGDPSSSTGGAAATGSDGGTGQGSPGGVSQGKALDSAEQTGQAPAQTSSDDDGSSPLVAILIAIAALAAISLGVLAMRARRQDGDPGSSVSPKAG